MPPGALDRWLLGPIRNLKRRFTGPRYEMIGPTVEQYAAGNGAVPVECNPVYRRIDGDWEIFHSHWSCTRPELAPAGR